MSDDLISRKALMERVLQEEYDNDIHKDGRAKAIHHGEYQHFYKTIAETPTAYDVDKVIEKIREIPHGAILNVELEEEIVEIVKSGGVADE